MEKLLAYRLAGARLTGCKSSVIVVDPPHTRDLTLPTGARLAWRDDRDRVNVWDAQRQTWPLLPGLTIDDVLAAWQPDTQTSVSRQHYVDTGLYLPVGEVERLALGVVEGDPRVGPDFDERPCAYVFDGTDTDGSDYFRCTTHDQLTLGEPPVCEGYRARPYVDPALDDVREMPDPRDDALDLIAERVREAPLHADARADIRTIRLSLSRLEL